MEEIGQIYGISKMAASKRLKKLYQKVRGFCLMTGSSDFFGSKIRSKGSYKVRDYLRHTFATLALQNGVDVKTVSSMLGALRCRFHPAHLHPRHPSKAGRSRTDHGQLHGTGDVS